MNVDYWWCIHSCSDHLDDHRNGFVLMTICLSVLIRYCLRWCQRLQVDRDRSRIRSSAQDLVTNEKSAIWSPDGPRKAPQTAITCLGRKLGHIEGPMGITGKKDQIARWHFSDWKSDIFDVFAMRKKLHKKSQPPCSPMVTFTRAGIRCKEKKNHRTANKRSLEAEFSFLDEVYH